MARARNELHSVAPGRRGLPSAVPDRSTMAQLARQTVAVVLAGGRGSRLGPLTAGRAKPAVPFGGKFRIIDFALSNCLNSGIRRIGVATQYHSHGLINHVQKGWSFLDGRFNEFIELLPAQQSHNCDWYKGTADAVYQNLEVLRRQHFHVFAHFTAQKPPAPLDMADQRMRLVLGEHADSADAGVDAVGQGKIDDAELAAEGHRRFGAPVGELLEAGAAPAGQYQCQCLAGETADETS